MVELEGSTAARTHDDARRGDYPLSTSSFGQAVYHGGEFSLVRTKLVNVRFGLGGAAHNTLGFLRLVRANGQHLLDSLLDQGPQPEPEQSVTIN